MHPRVSVLTSVYNGQNYLEECIDSILSQAFNDFEYIVLNNGSTDNTQQILDSYKDSRLRIINQENLGIARSLNRGIRLARSKLIARLDADDFSYPDRLELQTRFMENNPDIILLGSRCEELINDRPQSQSFPFLEHDLEIRRWISCFNPFAHSQMMFRKTIAQEIGGYDEKLHIAQDYDFWVRLLKFGKAHNLNASLGVVRLHHGSFSKENSGKLLKEVIWIKWQAYRSLGGDLPVTAYHILRNLAQLFRSRQSW